MRKLRDLFKGIKFFGDKEVPDEEPKGKRKAGPTHAPTLSAKIWPDEFFNKWEHKVVYPKSEKQPRIRSEKYRREIYFSVTGAVWNPLTGYPRNKGCWCGSGMKAKKCCLPFANRAISKKLALTINRQWDDFMTGHATLPKAPVEEKKAA